MRLRDLPSVDELTRGMDDPLAVDAARTVLARARETIAAGGSPGDPAALLRDELRAVRAPRLRRVLNATGVIVHTNLGRAPLAEEALARVLEVGRGYSNLEYERAVGSETALLLRVHQSNFRVVGFAELPRLDELAAVARRHHLPLVDDLGSGALADFEGEPSARESLAA